MKGILPTSHYFAPHNNERKSASNRQSRALFKSVGVFISYIMILQTTNAACAEPVVSQGATELGEVQGEAIYQKLCAQCHGSSGTPSPEVAQLFNPAPLDLSALPYQYGNTLEEIRLSIKGGRRGSMLSFRKRLSDAQIDAVARYVERLTKAPNSKDELRRD